MTSVDNDHSTIGNEAILILPGFQVFKLQQGVQAILAHLVRARIHFEF